MRSDANLTRIKPECRYPAARLQNFAKKFKKNLHLWKFLVISQVRTNFAEMLGNRCKPGSREQQQSRETRW